MKILLASDHAGYELKTHIAAHLSSLGHEIEDLGPFAYEPDDDYPEYVRPLALKLARGEADFGVILGGTGQGEAIAANRVPGVRAVVFAGGPLELIRLSRDHNDANVLSLGARFLSPDEAQEATELFLSTDFSGDERHLRRLRKIDG